MEHAYQDSHLCAALEQAGIAFDYHEHAAVFTVAESSVLNATLPEGIHIKNMFLKDRKKNFFLLSLEENLQVDLKALGKTLGAKGGLSFARPEQLWEMLGVKPGSVTPYAILNAEQGTIKQYFDEKVVQSRYFHAHPLRNDRTITAKTAEVIAWLEQQGYPIMRLDFQDANIQIVPLTTPLEK